MLQGWVDVTCLMHVHADPDALRFVNFLFVCVWTSCLWLREQPEGHIHCMLTGGGRVAVGSPSPICRLLSVGCVRAAGFCASLSCVRPSLASCSVPNVDHLSPLPLH